MTDPYAIELSVDFFKRTTKVLPDAPFGKRTTGLGAPAHARHTPLATSSAGIKILGIYCAMEFLEKFGSPLIGTPTSSSGSMVEGVSADDNTLHSDAQRPSSSSSSSSSEANGSSSRKRARSDQDSATAERTQERLAEVCIGADVAPRPSPSLSAVDQARRIYFRVLVDKSLEMVLPLELMRQRHPRVLIDYLLSTAAFY